MSHDLPRFPCHECGFPAETLDDLEDHWAADRHGPLHVADEALDRARTNIEGVLEPPTPLPSSASYARAVTQRRRLRVVR